MLTRRRFLERGALAAATVAFPSLAGAASVRRADCLVIGAGFAGLAAAKALRAANAKVIVLEARNRIGGRAWSDNSWPGLRPVEMGAGWIHGVRGNPLTTLASASSLTTRPFDYDRSETFKAGGVTISDSELVSIQQTFDRVVGSAANWAEKLDSDASLAASFTAAEKILKLSPAQITNARRAAHVAIEHEYAAPVEKLSAWWWDEGDELPGGDAVVLEGFSRIAATASVGLEIVFGKAVAAVTTKAGSVEVTTRDGGIFQAPRVIITLPWGVLKSGAVRFSPALPADKLRAIRRLGMGLLQKTALLFDSVFWPADLHLFDWFGGTVPNQWAEWVNLYPFTKDPALVGFNVGDFAAGLEAKSDQQVTAEAVASLSAILGRSIPQPRAVRVSRWGRDPFSLGAYSYMGIGASPKDRTNLAKPVDGRIFFAGEATSSLYPSTLHGAWLSGLAAAKAASP